MNFIDAACEVLSMKPEEVMKYATMDHFEADRMLVEKWKKLNPQTEEDIIRYYVDNPEFSLFHLRFICNMSESFRNDAFFSNIEKFIPDIRNYRILDYGCGSGSIGITFVNSGCINNQVWLADIPLPLFKIVKKMFNEKKDRGEINFIDITEKYPLKEMYDFISCIDVMEHVTDPDKVLKHLVEHINTEKYIYIDVFFGGAHVPYHLVQNNKFVPIWKDIIESYGLIPVFLKDGAGYNGLYRKK